MYTLIYFFATVFNSSLYLILDTPSKKDDTSVNFFNHFRKDFLRPHNLVHDALVYEDSTLIRRLNRYNCKFFIRPQFAMSEFAETLLQNMEYLENNAEILDITSLNVFLKKTKKFQPYLWILDSKKEETSMLHHIKIFNIMFIFIECTCYKFWPEIRTT